MAVPTFHSEEDLKKYKIKLSVDKIESILDEEIISISLKNHKEIEVLSDFYRKHLLSDIGTKDILPEVQRRYRDWDVSFFSKVLVGESFYGLCFKPKTN